MPLVHRGTIAGNYLKVGSRIELCLDIERTRSSRIVADQAENCCRNSRRGIIRCHISRGQQTVLLRTVSTTMTAVGTIAHTSDRRRSRGRDGSIMRCNRPGRPRKRRRRTGTVSTQDKSGNRPAIRDRFRRGKARVVAADSRPGRKTWPMRSMSRPGIGSEPTADKRHTPRLPRHRRR